MKGPLLLKQLSTPVWSRNRTTYWTHHPEKFQVVWKAEGVTLEEAEALQRAMVREFGGDPAATDSTRVLRLPGFANKKYDRDFYVEANLDSTQTYHLRDFKVPIDSQEAPRHRNEEAPSRSRISGAVLTQSEHDWAYAKACPRPWRRHRRNHSKNCGLSCRRQAIA